MLQGPRSIDQSLPKCPTGIQGLDEITDGGLPRGRPTLICGSAGCGKTLLAIEFLVRGATQFEEPGVFMAFEETAEELIENVRSLGFDLKELVEQGKLSLDHVHVERSEIEETGEYDLEGLFIRLGYAIDSIGAKRVVLDTLETLFSGLSNAAILRTELRRLFRWLKDKGVTVVITGERGDGALTRQGLEEYVSDCVILLDNRVIGQISTRRLQIVKYRGSTHGTNEYPFLIEEHGVSVVPITSLRLDHRASNKRVSSGIAGLDAMLAGEGFYEGSTVLVSGTAGVGKTSLAAHFVDAACSRGETCLYFTFEESQDQVVRNMRSIGIDLEPWIAQNKLHFFAARPTVFGLETHLTTIHRHIRKFQPQNVVIDPIGNLINAGTGPESQSMLTRLIDFLKARNITALLTHLSSRTQAAAALEATDFGISSITDTWILLRDIECGGERNRGLYVLKSRGMSHSNQIREYVLTGHGIELLDVYIGPEGVLTGSARLAQEARERAAEAESEYESERKRLEAERRCQVLQAKIAALQADLAAETFEKQQAMVAGRLRDQRVQQERSAMRLSRRADTSDVRGRNEALEHKDGQE